MPQQKQPKSPARRRQQSETEQVQILANSYCLRHYGVHCSGGGPKRLLLRKSKVWIVPVVFTSPGYGVVGDVGIVAIDAATHEVIGATPRDDVRAAVGRLAEEMKDELESAFRQASSV